MLKRYGYYAAGTWKDHDDGTMPDNDYRGFYDMKEVDPMILSVWGDLYTLQVATSSAATVLRELIGKVSCTTGHCDAPRCVLPRLALSHLTGES